MPKIMSDVWIKDNEINFYRETLHHTFNNSEEIGFGLLRRGISKIDDPLLIFADDGYDSFALQFSGNETAAKKMVEDSIIHFDQNQNVNINLLKNYFIVNIEQKISLDSAAAFVDYFLNSDKSSLETSDLKSTKGQTPPLERRNINSKENIMSDEFAKPRDLNEEAFLAQTHRRRVVADAIKAGTLCCLPGQDGYADTTPALNLVTGNHYHGDTMLFLKAFQKQNGFPTAEYVTSAMVDKAKETTPGLSIRQGQKGVSIYISEKNEQTEEVERKTFRLFNIAQTTKPWEMKKWVEKENEEYAQKNLEYLKTQYGSNWEPPEKKQKEPGPEVICSSTEPEKYLGQYLAAVSMGSRFKATPEQAAEFSEKMISAMYAPMEPKVNEKTGEITPPKINPDTGEPVTNPFNLSKISNKAGEYCKEFMRDLRIEAQKQNQPEQKQEQQQSRDGFRM